MNSDSVVYLIGGTGRNQIPLQTLASTTETLVLVNNDASATVAAKVRVPLQTDILGSSTASPYHGINAAVLMAQRGRSDPFANSAAPYFTSDSFNGRPFQVTVSGVGAAVANAGNTLTLGLYQGTSDTIGSDNKIFAPTALATTATASYNFYMMANLLWDAGSQALGGNASLLVTYNGATTYTSHTAVTPVASLAAASSLSFLFSVKWGNAVGGTCQVNEMSISLL